MAEQSPVLNTPSREQLIHTLYEAAELEHNLMCTYLYAAFSLKNGVEEGLTLEQAQATTRWRRIIIDVAVEEMSHLTAVWNLTAALGGTPRFGRMNFPLDPGNLPAGIVVKLAPFNANTLQHFIFLERPAGSIEAEGNGFAPERQFVRTAPAPRITPMGMDYATVGHFYAALSQNITRFVQAHGEDTAFCGGKALQLSAQELNLAGATPVICLKTALAGLDAIVLQGEGAAQDSMGSHFQKFVQIRTELAAITAKSPGFVPAHPAATNPVLRRPPRPEGRVWLEHEHAAATVDVANASYGLMLRLLAAAYSLPGPSDEKSLVVDLGIGLMRAMTHLAEHAARLPAGPSSPGCNAGMSFTALRDSAPLPSGRAARQFFTERLQELAYAAHALTNAQAPRVQQAVAHLQALARKAQHGFAALPHDAAAPTVAVLAAPPPAAPAPASIESEGVETVQGQHLTLHFETKRCIHARFCVTGAPKVFLANVQGAWLYPDAMEVERLADIAHACPSGAITYQRKDGRPDEQAPPVNLISVREAGPYALRGALVLDGKPVGYRATLCRCGASKNKPFCDGSHSNAGFNASGEPASMQTEMLPVRDGRIAIDPEPNGPLQLRGNMEIVSGTGRVVARVTQARLCRCGASNTKPFCDGSHQRIGFNSLV